MGGSKKGQKYAYVIYEWSLIKLWRQSFQGNIVVCWLVNKVKELSFILACKKGESQIGPTCQYMDTPCVNKRLENANVSFFFVP